MALCYLLDENLPLALWRALQQHNANGVDLIDALRVGDPPAPLLGTSDPDLLSWAAPHDRIVVTLDRNTMPGHLAAHLQAGHHSPGVFVLRRRWTVPLLVAALVLRAHAGDPLDFLDRIEYIP